MEQRQANSSKCELIQPMIRRFAVSLVLRNWVGKNLSSNSKPMKSNFNLLAELSRAFRYLPVLKYSSRLVRLIV